MKLSIAAAILANSFPSDDGVRPASLVEARHEGPAGLSALLRPRASGEANLAQKSLAFRKNLASRRGALKNFMTHESPFSSRECDPDLGLLACGFGSFCQESTESSLGGECVQIANPERGRDLQEVDAANTTEVSVLAQLCDPSSPEFGSYECDCADWNLSNVTGTLSCNLTEYSCNENCTDTCYAADFKYFTDGSEIIIDYCYHFVKPFEQSFCFGFSNDRTCQIELDGTTCSSCNTTYRLNCETGNCVNEPCANFDCNNVGLGDGNACEDSIVPSAYYECYLEIYDLYPSCSICPDSDGVLYPENEFEIPGYGLYNCTYVEYVATGGSYSPQECSYLAILAKTTCCESGSEPIICNICGEEGHIVSKPDETLDFPNQPSISCGNLEALADQGTVDEAQCRIVQGFVKEVCGCIHPDETDPPIGTLATPAPTITPAGTTPSPSSNSGSWSLNVVVIPISFISIAIAMLGIMAS